MAEFTEYKKNPGFWFWVQITIGRIVSEDPTMSASNRPFTEADVPYVNEWIKAANAHKLYHDRYKLW